MPEVARSEKFEHEIAASLVKRIGAGDRPAEGELVERYSRGLLSMLTARTRDAELARDLRQDTFCIAIEKLRSGGLENPEQLSAYLSGIARNLVIGNVRKQARRKTTSDTDFLQYCADDAPGQFDAVSRAQVRSAVRQMLREMTVERDRELLTRYYVYDEDKERICGELQLDSLHFNRVLYRAKERFRALLLNAEESGLQVVR